MLDRLLNPDLGENDSTAPSSNRTRWDSAIDSGLSFLKINEQTWKDDVGTQWKVCEVAVGYIWLQSMDSIFGERNVRLYADHADWDTPAFGSYSTWQTSGSWA